MNVTESKLPNDETMIYRTTYHWAMFLGPLLIIVIGGLALRSQGTPAVVLMAFGVAWYLVSYVRFRRCELIVTQKRVLIDAGFPQRKSYDFPLDEIIAVDYYQPSLGSFLNFGKIMIVSNKKSKCVMRFVSSPAEFVTQVRQQITALNPPQAKS